MKVGDKLRVEIADIDNRGKISLVLVADDDATADAAPAHGASGRRRATAGRVDRLLAAGSPVRRGHRRSVRPAHAPCRAGCGS